MMLSTVITFFVLHSFGKAKFHCYWCMSIEYDDLQHSTNVTVNGHSSQKSGAMDEGISNTGTQKLPWLPINRKKSTQVRSHRQSQPSVRASIVQSPTGDWSEQNPESGYEGERFHHVTGVSHRCMVGNAWRQPQQRALDWDLRHSFYGQQ